MVKNSKKQTQITLRPISIIYTLLIFFIGMCWAFILGIIIGRGYNIQQLLPSYFASNKTQQKATPKNKEPISSTQLDFFDQLKKNTVKRPIVHPTPLQKTHNKPKPAKPTPPKTKPILAQQNKKIKPSVPLQPSKKQKKSSHPAKTKKNKTSKQVKQTGYKYVYVYQFAALSQKKEAQKVLRSIKQQITCPAKLKCTYVIQPSKVKNKTLYCVLVKVSTPKENRPDYVFKKAKIKEFFLKQKQKL